MLSVSAKTTRKTAESVRLVRVGADAALAVLPVRGADEQRGERRPRAGGSRRRARRTSSCSGTAPCASAARPARRPRRATSGRGSARRGRRAIARTPPGSSHAVIASGMRRIVTDQSRAGEVEDRQPGHAEDAEAEREEDADQVRAPGELRVAAAEGPARAPRRRRGRPPTDEALHEAGQGEPAGRRREGVGVCVAHDVTSLP